MTDRRFIVVVHPFERHEVWELSHAGFGDELIYDRLVATFDNRTDAVTYATWRNTIAEQEDK